MMYLLLGIIIVFVVYAYIRTFQENEKLNFEAKEEEEDKCMFNPANGLPMLVNTDTKGNPKGFSSSDMFDYM